MSVAMSVRIRDDLASKLKEVAEETERPKSFHIQKAIEAYLADLADLQISLDRLQDPSDPIIDLQTIRKYGDL